MEVLQVIGSFCAARGQVPNEPRTHTGSGVGTSDLQTCEGIFNAADLQTFFARIIW